MRCDECGKEVSDEGKFCSECGAEKPDLTKEKNRGKSIFLSPLFLSAAGLILLAGIAGVSFYYYASSSLTADRMVDELQEAMEESDSDRFMELVAEHDDSWNFTSQNAADLMDFLHENESEQEEVFATLRQHADWHDNLDEDVNALIGNTSDSPYAAISLKQEGSRWLFFDDYQFEVTPAYLQVSADRDDMSLFLNEEVLEDDELELADEDYLIGPLAPGFYNLKGEIETEFMTVEDKQEIILFGLSNDREYTHMEFNLQTVEASAVYDGTSVYINGELTDVETGEGAVEIGELPVDGSAAISFEKEFPWRTVTSDDIPVEGGTVTLEEFEVLTEDEQMEIMEMLNENWKHHTEALMTGDASIMAYASDEYKERVEELHPDLPDNRGDYIGEVEESKYRLNSLEFPEYNEETERYELEVAAEYTVYEPQARTYALLREGDGDYNRTTYYLDIYYDEEDGNWMVENYSVGHFFITSGDSQESFEF